MPQNLNKSKEVLSTTEEKLKSTLVELQKVQMDLVAKRSECTVRAGDWLLTGQLYTDCEHVVRWQGLCRGVGAVAGLSVRADALAVQLAQGLDCNLISYRQLLTLITQPHAPAHEPQWVTPSARCMRRAWRLRWRSRRRPLHPSSQRAVGSPWSSHPHSTRSSA